ncbi:MAG: 1-(5-phosphoribosyl)-5-[(5-phosphoribosylamino)methylideneamino]imidazole-4-carboxamide isomerase [Bacteroidales bacterium]
MSVLRTEIIPAIDLIDGKCVRLSQGDYQRKVIYADNPVEMALRFADAGIRRLHLVDLDGAKAQHIVNHKVLEAIASKTPLVVDFGGGLKRADDLRIAFESGAAMVTGGSIAVKDPDTFLSWIESYGPDRIILGADVKEELIAVSGWQEVTPLSLFPFLDRYIKAGITKVICTDISRDGMMEGPSVDLYKRILTQFPGLFLIASGGVSQLSDIETLHESAVPAAITGKAIYEGKLTLTQIAGWMSGN